MLRAAVSANCGQGRRGTAGMDGGGDEDICGGARGFWFCSLELDEGKMQIFTNNLPSGITMACLATARHFTALFTIFHFQFWYTYT